MEMNCAEDAEDTLGQVEDLKGHIRLFQEKLTDLASKVYHLETKLLMATTRGGHQDVANEAPSEEARPHLANNSVGLLDSAPQSARSAYKSVNGELNHLVSTAYFCNSVRLPKDIDPEEVLENLQVREENGQLVVESAGESIRKYVNPGDTIITINGDSVGNEEAFKQAMQTTKTITLELVPSALKTVPFTSEEMYVRCLFDYDPANDTRLEKQQDGLAFKIGDILQVNGRTEEDSWQARKVDDWASHGLIPSTKLLRSLCTSDAGKGGKGTAIFPAHGDSLSFQHRIMNGLTLRHRKCPRDQDKLCEVANTFYEELVRMSPYGRRVLLLIGSRGVGRRTIKSNILRHNHDDFATVIPYTSRKPKEGEREGREYHFTSHHQMKQSIGENKFLEWGELNDVLYGTTMDSVRKVIKKGQVCVLDCSPEALAVVRNREFMPFTVFIEPPPYEEFRQIYAIHREILKPRTDEELLKICEESAKIKQMYQHQFDLILVNRNTDVTFRRLLDSFEMIKTQKQWIPSQWLS